MQQRGQRKQGEHGITEAEGGESLDRVTNSVEWCWRSPYDDFQSVIAFYIMEVTSVLPLPKMMDLAITQL